MRQFILHYTNPLHVYCRLQCIGISKAMAKRLAAQYERFIFNPIMRTA